MSENDIILINEKKNIFLRRCLPVILVSLISIFNIQGQQKEIVIDDDLSAKAEGKSVAEHPRLPIILRHNDFVRQTFLAVKATL